VFFDTTAIYFEGEGWRDYRSVRSIARNHRSDLRQMVVGIALDVTGRPLCCEMWPGNTTDVKTLVPVIERMRAKFRVGEILRDGRPGDG